MANVRIILDVDAAGWAAYVAAIAGDDGPEVDATPEDLAARDSMACEMMLADMGRKSSAHAIQRRTAEQAAQIEQAVNAQAAGIIAAAVVTVEAGE